MAGVVTPETRALAVKFPDTVFALTVVVATPLVFVFTVYVVESFVNRPLAPVTGDVNVTATFGTGLLAPSRTVAWRLVEYRVLTVALCSDPAVEEIVAAPDAVFDNENGAGVPTPGTEAGTV